MLTPLTKEKEIAEKIRADGVIYSHVFIKFNTRNNLPQALSDLQKLQNESRHVETVPEAYARGKAVLEKTLNRNTRYATIWAAYIIYTVFVLREQSVRMERRKKSFAILYSLGFSERRFKRLLISEQIILNFLTVFIGIWFATYVLESHLGFYVPRETILFAVFYVAVVILLVLGVSIGQLVFKLRKIDVARLLATE